SNPVVWREWNRGRSSRLAKAVWGLYIAGSLAVTIGAVVHLLFENFEEGTEYLLVMSILQASLGLLLVSLTSPTALAEERVRGGLDVLLTTPLSTASIVWGKWWGAYKQIPALALLPSFNMILIAISAERSRLGTTWGWLDRSILAALPI